VVSRTDRFWIESLPVVDDLDVARTRRAPERHLRPAGARMLRDIVQRLLNDPIERDLDVRRDHPYAAYGHLSWNVPVYREGDVLRRMQVRIDETLESLGLIRAAIENLPAGAYRAAPPSLPADRCAISAVEGWRGEIMYWLRTGPGGRLERCKVKDPSLNNWPALVEAVQGNIIADFPVINKSFNLSYSGTDR
jgi:Ni,Fe-hydrogenase III large subunit